MIKVVDLVPVPIFGDIDEALKDRELIAKELRESTNGAIELDVVPIEKGAETIESIYDEYVNAPYILQKVVEAVKSGANAVVIDCFGDPGLDAARELVDVPIIGANQASTYLAAQLASRFSIINILPGTEIQVLNLVRKYGLTDHLVSIETIDYGVTEVVRGGSEVINAVKDAVLRAVSKGAKAVVLGCTGMSKLYLELTKVLRSEGHEVLVIEPFRAALAQAISCALMGFSHSKLAYPKPRDKIRVVDFRLPL